MTITAKRRPRFSRGQPLTTLQITDRDLDILARFADKTGRFLTAHDVARLVGGSNKKVVERVGMLYYAGFLDRPQAQALYFQAGGGSQKIVYALSNLGQRVLADRGRVKLDRTRNRTRQNGEARRFSIAHALATADLAIRLRQGAAQRGLGIQLDREPTETLPEPARSSKTPFKMIVTISDDGERATYGNDPDIAVVLIFPDHSKRAFLVERDRASMPIKRRTLRQTSIIKKLLAYETARKLGLHTRQLGWKNFRVLIVTDGAERARNILEEIAKHPQLKASPLFLVADAETLAASSNVLTHSWPTSNGRTTQLI